MVPTIRVELKKLDPTAAVPRYATSGSAAVDLCANIEGSVTLGPRDVSVFRTGLAVHIMDPGVCMMLLPRSGMGTKKGAVLANLVGLVDSDYQGEVKVALWNRGRASFTIYPGDRIAQAVFAPVLKADFTQVEEFSSTTDRGTGGFGSTGA